MAKKQKSAPHPPAETSSDEYQLIPSPKHPHEAEDDDDFDESQSSSEQDDQPPSPNSQPNKPATSSDSETESDSGSDSKPKPLASNPMDQTKDNSALKRPAKNISGSANVPKRAKKNGTDAAAADDDDGEVKDVKKIRGDSKKLFQRLWSEEDEIAILKGMVEFTSKVGQDPYKYADAFYGFVKKSLHAEASSNQLKEKIRRLKQKFEKNALRGENGEDPNFSKPLDREAFGLSRKVWGNAAAGRANGAVEKAKSDEKVAKNPKKGVRRSTNVAPPKPNLQSKARSVDSNKDVKMDIGELTNATDTTSYLIGVIRDNKGVGLYGLSEDVIKRGMELIGASDRKELEGQWKELQAAELDLSVKRVELVANHARLILEAYKSSNHH